MASNRQRRGSISLPPDFSLLGSSSEPEEQPPQPLSLTEPAPIHTMNISSKYQDIISKSDQICSGPPAVYQLRPKKEKIGALTKMTVGEKQMSKPNKTILLVGETGAGKSTLINTLINYSMGVKFEDEVWFQIIEEERSQTSDVIVYEIFGYKDQTLPYSLTIINTPGYGNTRGIEHDDIISHRLLDFFRSEDGVHEVHAVGLVMKAESHRLSDRLEYVFDSLMSLFGKDLEKNTVALITHSEGKRPKNALQTLEAAKIKCAKNEKNQPVYFLFNNCQHEDRAEEEEEYLKHIYEISWRGMREFTDFLRKTTPLKPEAASEALKECIRLSACIQNLQERIKFTELKQREMKQTQEALNFQKGGITGSVAEVYKEKEAIRGKCEPGLEAALSCTVCEENCHYPGCRVDLTHCEVFRDGRCTSCTRKCPPSDHVKEKWRYVTRIRKIKDEKNETESVNKLSFLENLDKQINELTAEKKQLLEESYQHVGKVEEITLNLPAHSVSTYVHLDFLIEQMKEEGDTEKVQKLEEMRSREDEGTRAALQHTLSLISSRYEDVITNSFKICSGSPAVYQLRPKKQKLGTVSRMTVGEKNPNKINKTILLVGETGAGKSTLINTLINYSMGVKFEDEVWFQIVDEEKKSQTEGQTESQTSDVIVYEIFGYEDQTLPYSLTIIDTPGYGDTRGGEHDDIISHRLLDLFGSDDGVAEIHAVGLVMKATENRLSDRLTYVFNSVMSLFGKNVEKQILAFITHSNGVTPKNALKALEAAKIKCAKNKKNEPVHFLFDNCQHEDRTEENEAALKHSWDITQTGMGHMMEFLGKSGSQKLMTTVEVLKERTRLKACIQNLQERINLTELKQREIRETEEAVKEREEEMKKNQTFTVEVDEPYKVKEPIDGGMWGFSLFYKAATCCTVCEENCHYPGCTMALTAEDCWVMKDGRCTVCTNKCPALDHVKEKKKYVTKTRKVKKTIEDLKEKYEKNKEERENKSSLLENLKKEMIKLTAEKKQFLDESYQHVIRLEKIALIVDAVSTIDHLDFLIEKMKEEGDTEKVQKLEEMRSRVDKRTRAAHWYSQIQSGIRNTERSFPWKK